MKTTTHTFEQKNNSITTLHWPCGKNKLINRRSISSEDFDALCKEENVLVVVENLPTSLGIGRCVRLNDKYAELKNLSGKNYHAVCGWCHRIKIEMIGKILNEEIEALSDADYDLFVDITSPFRTGTHVILTAEKTSIIQKLTANRSGLSSSQRKEQRERETEIRERYFFIKSILVEIDTGMRSDRGPEVS